VASKKTKRVAAVTALSASLMIGGAAFAQANETTPQPCPWPGKGQAQGMPSDHHPGKGYLHRPHKPCKDQDNNGGNNNGGNNNGGGTVSDDHNIAVDVTVEVDLPNVTLPDAATMADGAVDHALSAAHQTVTLAESDVAGVMAIVEAAGDGATSLVNGTAQAGVSVTGTSASGTLNVSSDAAGATTFGSNLAGSTLNLVKGNVMGGGYIVGSMLAIL
jgi:hypothetical protein